MNKILILAALMAATRAGAVVRTVMEGTPATNNVIFLSTGPAACPTCIYVQTAGSMTVKGSGINTPGRIAVGTLIAPTTVHLDIVGGVRISSGIHGTGGNARGTNAHDLQLTRTYVYAVASGASSVIGGGGNNTAAAPFATVSGGSSSTITSVGDNSSIGGGTNNSIQAPNSHIGGGSGNIITASSNGGVICGGTTNLISDVSDPTKPSAICGGKSISSTDNSFVGGGLSNSAGTNSTTGGGSSNASDNRSFLGGGLSNTATGGTSVVAGGDSNSISFIDSQWSGQYASILGGQSNAAYGQYGTVLGGRSNGAAGAYALAAGRRAKAAAQGSMALTDSTDADFLNGSTDTFKARFAGGYDFTGGGVTVTSLNVSGSVASSTRVITTNLTASSIDSFIACDATSGSITVTLPLVAGAAGRIYYVKKIDSSANTCTVTGTSGQTIDGATTQVISARYTSISVIAGGTEWHIF